MLYLLYIDNILSLAYLFNFVKMQQPNLFETETPKVDSIKGAIVKPVSMETAKTVILSEHYSHDLPPRAWLNYGLYIQNVLAGIASFGYLPTPDGWKMLPPVKENSHIMELVKLAIYRWAPKNAGSFFVSTALRLLKKEKSEVWLVIAYADPLHDHIGFVYQSCNWIYIGRQRGNRSYLIDKDGKVWHPRGAYDRWGTSSTKKLDMKNISMPDKLVYVYQLQENEELAFWISQRRQEYPKKLSTKDKAVSQSVKRGG